jgi:hypothetical protein
LSRNFRRDGNGFPLPFEACGGQSTKRMVMIASSLVHIDSGALLFCFSGVGIELKFITLELPG